VSNDILPALDRRRLLIAVGTGLLAPGAAVSLAMAQQSERAAVTPQYTAARAALLAGRDARPGRVEIDVPRLAESGNSVSLKVTVASPMTLADHVRAVHLLSEQNPVAVIAKFTLGPRSGRAEVATNVRLATTQNVHALAEMSDGSVWEAASEVVVLIAACLDGA
jgi:sulfur-oxidizing protein SoxY